VCRDTMVSVSARVRIACACNDDGSCALRSRELQSTETQQSTLTVCVSLFYVNDIGSTGCRGRTWGFHVYALRLDSDAGYSTVCRFTVTRCYAHLQRQPCVSLFYVNDNGSIGSRGRTVGIPYIYPRLNSDAGYAVLHLSLLGAPVDIGRALGGLMA
jgi:hypothetical protein